ncbi:MAG TPA: DUF1543 domain-containing protein [Flavobacterium sp.]
MENQLKLYMLMIGCKPVGRFTEQHDIFFGIAPSMSDLIPQVKAFWPEAKGDIHIDAWRAVTFADGYKVEIIPKRQHEHDTQVLFFINLGGYKPDEFEEYHYKIITVADSLSEATKTAKRTTFYKHFGFKGATSHIDDKYGIDVDDAYKVEEMLSPLIKENYSINLKADANVTEDELHIGYLTLRKMATLNQ